MRPPFTILLIGTTVAATQVGGQAASYNWTRAVQPGRGAIPSRWIEGNWPMGVSPTRGPGDRLGGVDSTSVWSSADAVNWERVTNQLPWRPRRGTALAYFDGKLWLFGGQEGITLKGD